MRHEQRPLSFLRGFQIVATANMALASPSSYQTTQFPALPAVSHRTGTGIGDGRGGLAPWEQFGKRRNKEERRKREKNERNGLTLTGLLMEGVGGPKTTLRKECDFWDDLTTE
jgi:hypothetical protein